VNVRGVNLDEGPCDGLARPALLGLLLSAAVVPLASTTIALALGAIGREFGVEPAGLTQWLVNSYLVVSVVLQSPAGKLCDRWGVRRALALGQALFAAGALLGTVAGSLPLLAGARVLMAVGGALLVPGAMAALRNATEPQRRARAFGLVGAVMGLAAAVGPLVGGALADAFGWRSIFLINLPILAVAAPLLHGVRSTPAAHRIGTFDWAGSALLACGLTLAVAGSRANGAAAPALLVMGAAALCCFVIMERRAGDPVLDPALFRNVVFTAGASLVALHNWVMYALLFQLPLYFHTATGSGATETGRALMTMMLSMVASSPLGGRAAGRFGARITATTGALTLLAGLLLLSRSSVFVQPPDALPALILIGAGLGFAAPAAQAAALGSVPPAQSGMGAGALSTARYLGAVAGIAALGVVLADISAAPVAALQAHQRAIWLHCGVAALAAIGAAHTGGWLQRAGGFQPQL
jgi:MFS family permease